MTLLVRAKNLITPFPLDLGSILLYFSIKIYSVKIINTFTLNSFSADQINSMGESKKFKINDREKPRSKINLGGGGGRGQEIHKETDQILSRNLPQIMGPWKVIDPNQRVNIYL